MAQDFFSTGFTGIPASTTTGAPGSNGGKSLQFQNILTPDGVLDTGAPGSHDSGTVIDAGTAAGATDVFGILNGSNAPQIHGSTATSEPTGAEAIGSGTSNPLGTGAGSGHATNGSERIRS